MAIIRQITMTRRKEQKNIPAQQALNWEIIDVSIKYLQLHTNSRTIQVLYEKLIRNYYELVKNIRN